MSVSVYVLFANQSVSGSYSQIALDIRENLSSEYRSRLCSECIKRNDGFVSIRIFFYLTINVNFCALHVYHCDKLMIQAWNARKRTKKVIELLLHINFVTCDYSLSGINHWRKYRHGRICFLYIIACCRKVNWERDYPRIHLRKASSKYMHYYKDNFKGCYLRPECQRYREDYPEDLWPLCYHEDCTCRGDCPGGSSWDSSTALRRDRGCPLDSGSSPGRCFREGFCCVPERCSLWNSCIFPARCCPEDSESNRERDCSWDRDTKHQPLEE